MITKLIIYLISFSETKSLYETVEELYTRFETNRNGLTEEEVQKRLERDGQNKLVERKKKSNYIQQKIK